MRQSFPFVPLRQRSSFRWIESFCNGSVGFVCLIVAQFTMSQVVLAQGAYPATQYNGFGRENFSTSKPLQADSLGQNSYREMSPDNWAPENGVMRSPSPTIPSSLSQFQASGGSFASAQGPLSASGKVIRNQYLPAATQQGSANQSSTGNTNAQGQSISPTSQRKINPFEPAFPASDDGEFSVLDSPSDSESISQRSSRLGPVAPEISSADLDLSIAPPSIPDDIRKPSTAKSVSTQIKTAPTQLPSSNSLSTENSFPSLNPPAEFSPHTEVPANSIIRAPVNSTPTADTFGNHFDPAWALGGSSNAWSDPIPLPPSQPWLYPDSRIAPNPKPVGGTPRFRSDLGHRDVQPTIRHDGSPDHCESFDFEEKKKEYPPMSEILATGRYFGSATMMYLRPSFQANTAISETVSGTSTTFDFDYEAAPQFQVGFESAYGPGVELNYWQYDESSNPALFTSNGTVTGTTTVWGTAPNLTSSLSASNNGETLNAVHTLDIESFGANFFKFVQLPISRINGKFGWQYVSIAHDMNARLTNGVGNQIGLLTSRSDMRAIGPTFKLDYFRPVGHTKLELITGFGGSVLFGRQDHFVNNSVTGNLRREGADEILSSLDFNAGVQYRKLVGEKRYLFARTGFVHQSWLGGGNALLPSEDFGLRGFTFSVGYNH